MNKGVKRTTIYAIALLMVLVSLGLVSYFMFMPPIIPSRDAIGKTAAHADNKTKPVRNRDATTPHKTVKVTGKQKYPESGTTDPATADKIIISGCVTAKDTGRIVANAKVNATWGPWKFKNTEVDKNGRYSLSLPTGIQRVKMSVRTSGYVDIEDVKVSLTEGTAGKIVKNFTLARGIVLKGIVSDAETGKYVRGADVLLWFGVISVKKTSTDADGCFEFGGTPKGLQRIIVNKEKYVKQMSKVYITGKNDSIEVKIMPAGQVSGTTKDEAGNPLGNILVTLVCDKTPDLTELLLKWNKFKTRTDKNGCFVFGRLERGNHWSLMAGSGCYVPVEKSFLLPKKENVEIDFTLRKGITVSGKVVDMAGRPVEEVNITAMPRTTSNNSTYGESRLEQHIKMPYERPRGCEARTEKDGTYLMVGLAPGKYILKAVARDYLDNCIGPMRLTAGLNIENLDFVLDEGFSISDTVALDNGSAVKNALVDLGGDGSYFPKLTCTDENGKYIFRGLIKGEYSVGVIVTGYYCHPIKASAPSEEINLSLLRNGWVKGKLVGLVKFGSYTVTAKPTDINMWDADYLSRYKIETLKNSNGTFEIDLAPGRYEITAVGDGFANSDVKEIDMKPGVSIEGMSISVSLGASVKVIAVTAENTTPIAEAEVRLYKHRSQDSGKMGLASGYEKTDAKGKAMFRLLEAGIYVIEIRAPGYALTRYGPFEANENRTASAAVTLKKGGVIKGNIRIKGNKKTPQLIVFAEKTDESGESFEEYASVDKERNYEISCLPAGAYTVTLTAEVTDGLKTECIEFAERLVDVDAGKITVCDFDAEPVVRVHGKITSSGEPFSCQIGFTRIHKFGTKTQETIETETDISSGKYSTLLKEGKYLVQFFGKYMNRMLGTTTIKILGERKFNFDYNFTGNTISGKVVSVGKTSIMNANVSLVRADAKGSADMLSHEEYRAAIWAVVKADDDANFKFTGMPAGKWKVVANPWKFSYGESTIINVGENSNTAGIKVIVPPGSTITGKIFDPRGKPVTGAFVILIKDEGAQIPGTTLGLAMERRTDSSGSFLLPGVREGKYRLYVVSDSFGQYAVKYKAHRIGVRPLKKIKLQYPGDIEICVTSGGKPVPNATVELRTAGGIKLITQGRYGYATSLFDGHISNKDGMIFLGSLSPGRYTAIVRAKGYKTTKVQFPVTEWEVTTFKMELERHQE